MERDGGNSLRQRLHKLSAPKGAAPMKTLIILMFLSILVGFAYQVFMVYSVANTVQTAVQRSMMSVASCNMPALFDSFKEGGASASDLSALVTSDEICQDLSDELGMELSGDTLVKNSSSGGWLYRICDLSVAAVNTSAGSGTVRYSADFVVEVPVAEYWNFGSFRIPMHVEAKYTSKY